MDLRTDNSGFGKERNRTPLKLEVEWWTWDWPTK
jgi:hypothetical protein